MALQSRPPVQLSASAIVSLLLAISSPNCTTAEAMSLCMTSFLNAKAWEPAHENANYHLLLLELCSKPSMRGLDALPKRCPAGIEICIKLAKALLALSGRVVPRLFQYSKDELDEPDNRL